MKGHLSHLPLRGESFSDIPKGSKDKKENGFILKHPIPGNFFLLPYLKREAVILCRITGEKHQPSPLSSDLTPRMWGLSVHRSLCPPSSLPVMSARGTGEVIKLEQRLWEAPELSLKRRGIFLPPRGRKLIFPMHPTPSSSCSDELNFLLLLMKMDESQAIYSGGASQGS